MLNVTLQRTVFTDGKKTEIVRPWSEQLSSWADPYVRPNFAVYGLYAAILHSEWCLYHFM